jgi:hypothetical protein
MNYRTLLATMDRLERAVIACGEGGCGCGGSCGCGGDCGDSCGCKTANSTDAYFGPQNTQNDYNYGGDFAFTRPDSYVNNVDYNRQEIPPSYDDSSLTARRKR